MSSRRAAFSPFSRRAPPPGAELTLSGYEFYPQALANTIRWAHKAIGKPIYVTESGIADARRVCIYGVSYGGYAALAGVAFGAADGDDRGAPI